MKTKLKSYAEMAAVEFSKAVVSPPALTKLPGYKAHEYEGEALSTIRFRDQSYLLNIDNAWIPTRGPEDLTDCDKHRIDVYLREQKHGTWKTILAVFGILAAAIGGGAYVAVSSAADAAAASRTKLLSDFVRDEIAITHKEFKKTYTEATADIKKIKDDTEKNVQLVAKSKASANAAARDAELAKEKAEKAKKSAEEASKGADLAKGKVEKAQNASDHANRLWEKFEKILDTENTSRLQSAIARIVEFDKFIEDVKIPVGTIVPYAGPCSAIPSGGWLLCDGRHLAIPQKDGDGYYGLYKAIGTSWGGDDRNFNLPDLQGLFLRGVKHDTDRDPDADNRDPSNPGGNKGNKVGSVQEDSFLAHMHRLQFSLIDTSAHPNNPMMARGYHTRPHEVHANDWSESRMDRDNETTLEAVVPKTRGGIEKIGGNETRPKNAYVNWIIKAK